MRMMERRKQFSLLIYFRKIFPSKMSLLKVSHLFKNFDTCQQGKCQVTAKSLTRQFSKKTAIKGIVKGVTHHNQVILHFLPYFLINRCACVLFFYARRPYLQISFSF